MNLKLDVVRFENEDVITTSGCYWNTLKTQSGNNIYYNVVGNNTIDTGKSFLYSGETGSIGPSYWSVGSGNKFYDANGNLVGTASSDGDVSNFTSGSYYHACMDASVYGMPIIWVECNDPSHYSN